MTNRESISIELGAAPLSGVLYPRMGSMGDENHTPEMIEARIADQRARYCIGMVVQRNDFGEGTGPMIRITSMEKPTCGGYIYAHGDLVSEWDDGGVNYATGPIHKCTPVPWVLASRHEIEKHREAQVRS